MKTTLLWLGCLVVGCGSDSNTASGDGGANDGAVAATGGDGGSSGGSVGGNGGSTGTGGTTPGSGGTTPGSGGATGGVGGSSVPDSGASDATLAQDGAADGSAEASSGCRGACVEPAPTDWLGPFAFHSYATGGPAPSCAGAFPSQVDDYFSGFRANAASCDCACHVAADSCSVDVWVETTCTPSGNPSFVMSPASCETVSESGYFITGPVTESVTCSAPVVTEVLPTPTFSTGLRACEGTLGVAGCTDDTLCAPKERDASVCIMRAGTPQCPAGPYSERQVVYTGFTDNRDCSTCTCSGSPTCSGTIELRNGGCTSSQVGTVAVDDSQNCSAASLSPTHAVFRSTTYGGRCDATGGELTGNARATGPQTICCVP